MDAVAANGYILEQICSNIYGTSQKSLCGCQKATAVNRPDTGMVRSQPSCSGYS